MNLYHVDLHIHTVLSPCAELDMGAPEIIARCRDEGIDMIAITDHNSARNTEALSRASAGSGVAVINGLEVQSSEDIHIICLMPDGETAGVFEEWIVERLPCIRNIPDKFGTQLVIDENNIITGESGILLVQGIDATADEIVDRARAFGGISILAHIDRPVYSYVAVLGMIPKDLEVDAVELSANLSEKEALQWLNETGGRPVIRSSDAHRIPDISIERTTPVLLKKPSFDELGLALKGIHGRRVLWPWGQDQT
ncbi:MAG TPA: PHP domain-containing protein [Thermovirgaceae bacterium]|jgi:hypothetical protein|nr:PHP domain-containing protein [Synergistales bacterium]HPJ48802.1 PHP domain-containing protein [Synergistales bacterium]HRW87733.1 PHP domain-containing protein [Thermovirgaceae bacterium]